MSIKQRAKALIPLAEEAMPLLCGKLLVVSILNLKLFKNGKYISTLSKNFLIFGSNETSLFPSRYTSKSKPSVFFFSKDNEVLVLQFFKVKLTEAFMGICSPYFPQYFTKAILLGDCQETVPDDRDLV
jgi:hypothetical protein